MIVISHYEKMRKIYEGKKLIKSNYKIMFSLETKYRLLIVKTSSAVKVDKS